MILPAGHTHTITSKAYATETKSELEKAFHEYKQDVSLRRSTTLAMYRLACDLIKPILPCTGELHALIMNGLDSDGRRIAPIFLSAGYNLSDEDIITYDLDVPLNWLGFDLPKEKLLINRGTLGSMYGVMSSGTIVNVGNTQSFMGQNACGIVLNAGHTENWFGTCKKKGIAASLEHLLPDDNYGKPGDGYYDRLFLDCTGSFREYLEHLSDLCHGYPQGLYEQYGPTPSVRIAKDIRKLTRRERFLRRWRNML